MIRLAGIFILLILLVSSCSKKEKTSENESTLDPTITESIARGQIVYKNSCITCHMADGLGAPPMNPPLVGTSFVKGNADVIVPVILKGLTGQEVDGQAYHNIMPPMEFLTDEQIADVLTYVRNSFGNKEGAITTGEVVALRGK